MAIIPDLYPLTGLQIGDIQSYVSQAFLYFAPISKRILILVDNRPWMLNKHSRSAKLWQLMVTKDLSKALHGFIIFEVAWKDVHGINYLNELQMDATLALEVKFMRKWEFHSPEQALSSLSFWFSGRPSESQSLNRNLRLLFDVSPTTYTDKLMLFRFSDCVLPVKLRQAIMSDLRLLRLLEAGLPSWVIFFQSYPFFCHFYRPWMRHLARTLYILMSLITVIIGFYDLYKNVPLLKATASRICGPLFSWIEEWDMISRIKYIGTMLFLQNFEKGLKWFIIFAQMMRTVISGVARPLTGPLMKVAELFSPLWNAFVDLGKMIFSNLWLVLQFLYGAILNLIECFLQPFELLFSYISCTGTKLVQPLLCFLWDLLLLPIQCAFGTAKYMRTLFSEISFKEFWESGRHLFKLASVPKPKRASYDISMWQALWNDLFSHIFRAMRSIINGLLAFFVTCNRHRLRYL
ncbi:hypothetical protein AXF42_Ash020153 [Apostasia shenzhenica]|uniref:Uncharacterized protein n=1 Tax=Apostasia shenzhenica TaxID=1088818 RepID=A0A2H9ZVW9_9ASPA|nr:hypothetical protein AXF42_Ash020153 [Apostasia shenzhenica]